MKDFIRRVFVVLWIIAALSGFFAVSWLFEDGNRNNIEDAFFNWLACCIVLLAAQYIVTGKPNPIDMFDPPD